MEMSIDMSLTALLGIMHPILLAPMDVVSGARLTAAVSSAGGFGILGGGYGEKVWLEQETSKLKRCAAAPFGIGFITWSLARQPELLDIALNARPRAIMLSFGDPKPFASRINAAGALLICQVQSEDMAQAALDAGADILVAQGTEAGGHGASRTTLDIVPAIIDLVAGRRWYRRRMRARGDDGARCRRCAPGYALLCQSGIGRSGGGQATNLRRDGRQHHAGDYLRHVTQQRLAGAVHGTLPDQRSCASLDRPRTRTAAKCRRGRRRICGGQGRGQFRYRGADCRRSRWADP